MDDPLERLLSDLCVVELMMEGEQYVPSDAELADGRRRLAAVRERLKLASAGQVELAPRARQTFRMELDAAATLAAADVVKLIQEFEIGTLRMIESAMRTDLAVEIVLKEELASDYEHYLCFVAFEGKSPAIAVLPDASPVFSGYYLEDFAVRTSLSIELVHRSELDEQQQQAVKRSRRSLRDPADRTKYDAIIAND